jgi:hypothetical protein
MYVPMADLHDQKKRIWLKQEQAFALWLSEA